MKKSPNFPLSLVDAAICRNYPRTKQKSLRWDGASVMGSSYQLFEVGPDICLVMGTIMLDHKIGVMLDHDLIEENL